MRQPFILPALVALLLAAPGCAPEFFPAADVLDGSGIEAVVSGTVDPPADDARDDEAADAADVSSAPATAYTFDASIAGDGDYRLYRLGAGSAGDEWSVTASGLLPGPFVVALFDADMNLLMRTFFSYTSPLRHVLREDSPQVYLGIMAPAGGEGGDFHVKAALKAGQPVPPPAQQVVWLNFAGGANVQVHHRDPISFAAFDGAMIGEQYAAYTQQIKDTIVQEMRADYASYNLIILSSDDGPPPSGPYSTVHFGGSAPGLLGLADSVDNYNQNPVQDAVVYIENFAPYWTMELEADEMAVMIANVASHELGHLLGLYHTADPDDLMDTTATAWELAENQTFTRAPLEQTVFATGWEDSPRLLLQILGASPDTAKAAARHKPADWWRYKAIRSFARREVRSKCGTCLSLASE